MEPNKSIALRSAFLGALTCVALLAGCSKTGEPVLAKVGAREFRAIDLKAEVDFRVKNRRPIPDNESLLREMMTQEALLQRARQAGLENEFAVRRELDNLLVSKLWDREAVSRVSAVTVSEDEVKAEYERNLSRYTQPPKVRLAMLQLNGQRLMSDAKRAELRSRMEEARSKALAQPAPAAQGATLSGFGTLAVDYSEDVASRFRGGDLGWLDQESSGYHWPAPVLKTGYSLPRGKVSEVLEVSGTFYLVMKTDERPSAITPFAQIQAALKQAMLQKRRQGLEATFREESLARTTSIIDLKALAAIKLPVNKDKEMVASTSKSEPPSLPGGKSFAP